MSVKINGKKLHLKTFEITRNGYRVRKSLEFQKTMAQMEMTLKRVKEDDDESMIRALDAQMKAIDAYTAYLKDVLNLSDDQVKKVQDSDIDDVSSFCVDVLSVILQMDADKSSEDKG